MNKKILVQTTVAVSAGLLLTACSSMHHERASYSDTGSSYVVSTKDNSGAGFEESSGAQSGYSSSSQNYQSGSQSYQSSQSNQQQSDREELIIPLHQEQLNVSKQSVNAGQVTIRKIVTTETVNQPVELRRERVVIEREGAGGQVSSSSGQSFGASSQSSSSGSASAGASLNQDNSASVSAQAAPSSSQDETAASAQQSSLDEPAGAAANYQSKSSSGNTSYKAETQRSSTSSSSGSDLGNAQGNAFQEQTYTIQLREEQPVIQKNVVQTGRVIARKNAEMQRQNIQQQVRKEDIQLDKGANSQNVEVRGDFNTSGSNISEPSGAERPALRQESSVQESQPAVETQVETRRIETQHGKGIRTDDPNTLDDINKGSNTRGGAEDLQDFDENATDPKY